MRVFSILALATSGIRGEETGLTGLCEKCYEGGTEKCSGIGKCICKQGFEGLYCNSCSGKIQKNYRKIYIKTIKFN